ncbi:hypothetical protein ACEWY4_025968 [Coilia grayii]|uniref:GLTSCR protein conserved domain-containing protein n=1 Tax=Coilia grayii TaxID=363190 RepID=A0ABD1ITH0_9TELE
MDDEDDRRLLDIIGDVQALNDYLHGPNSKSIEEEDVTNAAYGNSGSFFTSSTGGSSAGIKDNTNHLGEFSDAGEAGLQLSNSLQFIEDELGGDASPGDVDLGGEDQPFDILQKSLLEADITEQTLAQEALLESQPALAPAAATTFPPQLVSGGFGGGGVAGSGVVAPLPLAGAQPQAFLQQVPQLPMPNGPTGHIQVLGSFNGNASSMMAINSLLRPTGAAVTSTNSQGQVFAPMAAGQVSMPFKGCGTPIPVQNIIIQRGHAPQALVRPIQPKPLQPGAQTVYNLSNLGLQPNATASVNTANAAYAATGSPQAPQQVKVVGQPGSIVVHSSLGQQGQQQQQQQQAQANVPAGQFLLPNSLSLTPGSSVQGFQAVNGQVLQTSTQPVDQVSITTTYSILPTQSGAVQLIAGQNLTASGGQLIVNQGVVTATATGAGSVGQMSPTMVTQVRQGSTGGAVVTPKVWTGVTVSSASSPSTVQVAPTQTRLTLVSSSGQGLQTRQQVTVGTAQRLLVPVAQNATGSAHAGVQELQFEMQAVPLGQDSSVAQKAQPQLVNLLGTKGGNTVTSIKQEAPCLASTQLNLQKRPAPQQLTRGGMILQQLRQDHAGVSSSDRVPFSSLDDVVHRLLPFHVFQGALPSEEEFAKVDEEFEAVASQVLKRTQAMVNKYRRLLMVEAERSSPSSEMVMIDRTFNQEERSNLTQDRRMVLVDPDGYLEDFCCMPRLPAPSTTTPELDPACLTGSPSALSPPTSYSGRHRGRGRGGGGGGEGGGVEGLSRTTADSGYRTEYQPGFEDPGGGPKQQQQQQQQQGGGHTAAKSILEMKKNQRCSNNNVIISSGYHQHQHPHPLPHSHQQPHYQVSHSSSTSPGQHSSAQVQVSGQGRSHGQAPPPEHSHQPLLETDSVLEAAVNSILEC